MRIESSWNARRTQAKGFETLKPQGSIWKAQVEAKAAGRRLDRWLSERLPELSRARVQKLIREGRVRLDGKAATKPSTPLAPETNVEVELPSPEGSAIEPEEIPLEILYEDEDLVAVNKPAGMVVYPAAGHAHGTLVQGLLHGGRTLSAAAGAERPGVVHRLDKDTSGVIVLAKSDLAYYDLVKQFRERTVEKVYWALVHGILEEEEGVVEAPLGRDPHHPLLVGVRPESRGGRPALTTFRVVGRFPPSPAQGPERGVTLLEVRPHTGRTHQIRVHLKAIGHPIVGDPVYGPKRPSPRLPKRLMLHAWRLELTHPRTGKRLRITAPLPPEFSAYGDPARRSRPRPEGEATR